MKQREEFIHRINYLTSEMDAMYHRASLKLGISDSVSLILYTIYDAGGSCLLSEIYKKTGISKQTVNSALRGLEGKGILALQQYKGRAKKVVLTEAGICRADGGQALCGRSARSGRVADGGDQRVYLPDGKICRRTACTDRTIIIIGVVWRKQ